MQISVADASLQTLLFGIFFGLALIFSIRRPKESSFFGISRTQELKGFAILAIVFSHIGYFLSTDTKFLYPFSILAGVGVNLFLFLSGFGLTLSSLKNPLNAVAFYKKRLIKLFIPLWIVISFFFLADWLILQKTYPLVSNIQNYLGFFPKSELFLGLDSPLWYFSLILFYYLIFPLVFWKKFPYLSPVLILLATYFLLGQPLPIKDDVINLYKLHSISFPLGVMFALLVSDPIFSTFKLGFKKVFLLSNLKYLLIPIFIGLFAYTSIHSGVGLDKDVEQARSLITMFSIIFLFVVKPFEFRLFYLFGIYSYEIYLIHWPILSRYDIFYKYLPAWLSTLLYLALFIGLGYLLQKLTKKFS